MLTASNIVGEMATRDLVASLAGACLTKFERNLLQLVPLVHPQGLVGASPETRLHKSKYRHVKSQQLLHKVEQVMLEPCFDYWRYFKHNQVSCG